MDLQQQNQKLKAKLLELQARSKFQAMGGDVSHWDSGLKNGILPNLTLDDAGDLDQAAFDAVVKEFPGIDRHMAQPEQAEPISLSLPDTLSVNSAWAVLDAVRAASSPRR